MANEVKIRFKKGELEIEIQSQKEDIKEILSMVDLLNEAITRLRGTNPLEISPSNVDQPSGESRVIDIRTFFNEKKPSSEREAITVAAYYLKYLAPVEQRRDSIDKESLTRAFEQTNFPIPVNLPQQLINARKAGYIDPTSESGTYKINPVGYNLVAHTLGKAKD